MQSFLRSLGALFLAATILVLPAAAQNNNQPDPDHGDNPNTFPQADMLRVAREVQHKLLSLPTYAVFDSLGFSIRGRTIVLEGYASRPVLKSDAENAVKSIAGIEGVENQIKVLPPSMMDDRIRSAVYRRVYSQPMLRKYTGSPVGFGQSPSVARAAGGITQDPPMGYNAIHIIVDNGHVILTGAVNNETDASVANMQANSTPGVFSVTNDLRIAGKPTTPR